jgi:hypothetical protein
MPNDTPTAQEGPEKVDVKLSATPRMSAATNVPLMLPIPPNTVMANTLPM